MNLNDAILQLLNVTLLLSVGLELRQADLVVAARDRAGLAAAAAVNLVAIPALAIATVWLLGVSGGVAAGVLLAAFCPGGGTGTLLTRTARGNLERSVVLLGMLTTLAVIATPLLTRLAAGHVSGSAISLWPMLHTLLIYQLAPLVAGVGLRALRPGAADRLSRVARPLSNAVFAIVVVGLLVTRGHLVLTIDPNGLLAMAVVVAASLGLPALLPSPTHADRAAVSLTTGVRNLSLALLLASTFFTDATTLAVLVYGLVMYAIAVPAAVRWRRHGPPHARAATAPTPHPETP